ncbi:MAG TPA: ABC transporter permease [Gemmatimonadaceae bacterium]|nr:ABC transporter permease [Gemmatimonadaceae bacterium]
MDILADLRFAARSLRRAPVFALAAILALGVGTGSASAVFSLLDGVVLKPLPYANPDQLVSIWETNTSKGLEHEPVSPVNFGDYRALDATFVSATAWWHPEYNLTDQSGGDPMRVSSVEAARNFFDVMGVQPARGRGFTETAATLFGPSAEVVISDRLFRTRFGGQASVIGSTIQLNGDPFTIVGVMPEGFNYPGSTDVWQGLRWDLAQHSRAAHFMESVARLKPGVSAVAANAALKGVADRLGRQFVATNQGWGAKAVPLAVEIAGVFRPALVALFGASGLLLAIACINVANLLLARASAREREVAVRTALGATRGRLVRLFLVESGVLAAAGAMVGLGFAFVAVRALLAWTPVYIPRSDGAGVNLTVVAFSVAITTLAALAFGLAPALLMARGSLHAGTKAGTRDTARSRGRNVLVVAEVSLAVMLLAGSGLLMRTVDHLVREHSGVDPESVITANVQLPDRAYEDWARVGAFYGQLVDALKARPEVADAGVGNFLPLDAAWRMPLRRADEPAPVAGADQVIQNESVDASYFTTMHIPLIRGRMFDAGDVATAAGVVIVNEALAKRFWPGEDPVGKHVVTGARQVGPLGRRIVAGDDHEVIGVAADVKNTSIKSPAEPAVFFTQEQFPFRKMNIVVRTRGSAARGAAALREEMRKLDPSLPAPDVKSMTSVIGAVTDTPRFVMFVMAAFALLALTLAAVGIYGILNYAVNRRRHEFAIRLALGAAPRGVLGGVLREGVGLAAIGCAVGVLVTMSGGRVLQGLLYEVAPTDGITLSAVLTIVLGVAFAACVTPAWRAARQDPVTALREE